MHTVSNFDVREYVAVQDLADALEAWLPKESRGVEQLSALRNQLEQVGATPIGEDTEGPGILKAIHSIGAEMVANSLLWRKAKGLRIVDEDREQFRLFATQEVEEYLADYDLPKYLHLLASVAQTSNPAIIAAQRLEALRSKSKLGEDHFQDAAALMKWDISLSTSGNVAPPSPHDYFDPLYLNITREWTDAEHVRTTLNYAGQELTSFHERALLHELGHRFPRSGDATSMMKARNLFYHGCPINGVKPFNPSSLSAMTAQVEHDLKLALSDTSLHSIEKHALRSIYDRLAFLKPAEDPAPDSAGINQVLNAPGIS